MARKWLDSSRCHFRSPSAVDSGPRRQDAKTLIASRKGIVQVRYITTVVCKLQGFGKVVMVLEDIPNYAPRVSRVNPLSVYLVSRNWDYGISSDLLLHGPYPCKLSHPAL